MATWTTVPDASLNIGKPVRSIDAFALRDNPIAIAEGAVGAPKIETLALDINAVLDATARDYTWGAVGTHAFLWMNAVAPVIVPGNTYAGSLLRAAGIGSALPTVGTTLVSYGSSVNIIVGAGTNDATMSGTWMALGLSTSAIDYPTTLFVRVA